MILAEAKLRMDLFKDRSFLYFSLSGLLATLGNGLNYIALSWFVYEQTQSIHGVALMMFFMWMPSIVFAPLFGIWADRYSRKLQIILSNLVRGVAIALWLVCLLLGLKLNIIFLIAILGFFTAFYMPSAIPFIQSLVPEEKLLHANSMVDMIYEFGMILGMGVSGFLLVYIGNYGAFFLASVLFIVAGLLNMAMREPKKNSERLTEAENWWQSYQSSFSYLKKNPAIILPYSLQTVVMVLLMTIPVLLVPYTREVLHADARSFALFEALYSLGALIGGFMVPIICRFLSHHKTLALLLTIMAIALAGLASNGSTLAAFPFYFLVGFGLASWALSISLSQMACALEYQGRLQASFNGLSGCFILALYLVLAFYEGGVSPLSVYWIQSLLAFIGVLTLVFCRKVVARSETQSLKG